METGRMCTQISRARVDRSCPHVVLFRHVRGAAHIARIRCDSGSRSDPLECGERGSSSQPDLRAESRAERRAEGARPGARCSRVQIGKFKNKKSKIKERVARNNDRVTETMECVTSKQIRSTAAEAQSAIF